jgi:23S rRNA (uridine2552-2'-O)-methyltransferase
MSKSSKAWLYAHHRDPYVLQARQEGYRSRAAYKLKELLSIHPLLKPGMWVADLGAAPGGWSQVVSERLQGHGRCIAVDLLSMETIGDPVTFIQGDFTQEEIQQKILEHLENRQFDLILSDMAPNFSGIKDLDHDRSIVLVEEALVFADAFLKPQGSFLVKLFSGAALASLKKDMQNRFKMVKWLKPKASHRDSAELYVLGIGKKS